MTLKIERFFEGHPTTLHLIGRIRAEHLSELEAQIRDASEIVMDLEEVTLVDVEVVRFLGTCEARGADIGSVLVVSCSAFPRRVSIKSARAPWQRPTKCTRRRTVKLIPDCQSPNRNGCFTSKAICRDW
jgi:hypothetical protein